MILSEKRTGTESKLWWLAEGVPVFALTALVSVDVRAAIGARLALTALNQNVSFSPLEAPARCRAKSRSAEALKWQGIRWTRFGAPGLKTNGPAPPGMRSSRECLSARSREYRCCSMGACC